MATDEVVLITEEDLATRLSPAELRRAFDDDGDDVPDYDPVKTLCEDASSMVCGYAIGLYETWPIVAPFPRELVRFALDAAVAMAAQRFPSALPTHDGYALMAQTERQLTAFRAGKTRLNTKQAPEPARNQGAKLFSQRSDGCPTKKTFIGGMGDF